MRRSIPLLHQYCKCNTTVSRRSAYSTKTRKGRRGGHVKVKLICLITTKNYVYKDVLSICCGYVSDYFLAKSFDLLKFPDLVTLALWEV